MSGAHDSNLNSTIIIHIIVYEDVKKCTRIPIVIECGAFMALRFTFKECNTRIRNSDCESPVTGD